MTDPGRGECGGTVSSGDGMDEVARFAALLTELKARTERSYGSLARRVGMNTSTLHRYCAGEAVPQDFAPVERLAEFCGATPEERLELHRRWLRATAARQQRGRGVRETPEGAEAPEGSGEAVEQDPAAGPGPITVPDTGTGTGAIPGEERPTPLHRPWYRRRRTGVLLGAACVLLATLGTLSALPGGSGPGDREVSGEAVRSASTDSSPTARPTAPRSPPPTPDSASPAPLPSPGSGGAAQGGGRSSAPATGVPLAWTADSQVWAYNCGHDYVIDKPPAQVPPPPAEQDAGPWASAQGAVHGRETNVEISVQGRSSTAVVLTALRVRVVGRDTPVQGNAYAMDQGCGGSLSKRYFAVDLDKDRPIAHSVAGNDAGTPIPAVRMPYRVSAEDPEVLLVTARTQTCDCSWYLELDWSSQGRTGTIRIDDRGRPFRTSGTEGLPRYSYGTNGADRRWIPYA